MLRDAAVVLAGFLVCFVVVLVGVPLVIFGLLLVQEKGWIVKLKNLVGGVFFAVVIAVVLSQTVGAVYIECFYPWMCWPFAAPISQPIDGTVGK